MNRTAPSTDAGFDSARPAALLTAAHKAWRATQRLAHEPLVHFFVLSMVLWGIHAYIQPRSQLSRITITKAAAAQLAEHYRQQYGVLPSPSQLDALVDAAITEEISYRQAIKLGLDQGDQIVRRRLVQKYDFLQQDLAAPRDPTTAEAQDYYSRHAERYVLPERLTFTHVYFSPDRRGDAGAREATAALAAALNLRDVKRAAADGDPYPGPMDLIGATPEEIARVFGRNGLSQDIAAVPIGHWTPPLRSGFGWHTVYVTDRQPARRANFEEVYDQVTAHFREAESIRRTAEANAAMRSRFKIVRE